MTVLAPPTFPPEDRIPTPYTALAQRAYAPDGTVADPDALARLHAILDAHLFLGPIVEVLR